MNIRVHVTYPLYFLRVGQRISKLNLGPSGRVSCVSRGKIWGQAARAQVRQGADMALAFPPRQHQLRHSDKHYPLLSLLTFDCEVTAGLHIVQLTDNQLKRILSVKIITS